MGMRVECGGGGPFLTPPCLCVPRGGLTAACAPPQLAHAIRLLLEHTGTPYEDKLYSCGEGEGGGRQADPPTAPLPTPPLCC